MLPDFVNAFKVYFTYCYCS